MKRPLTTINLYKHLSISKTIHIKLTTVATIYCQSSKKNTFTPTCCFKLSKTIFGKVSMNCTTPWLQTCTRKSQMWVLQLRMRSAYQVPFFYKSNTRLLIYCFAFLTWNFILQFICRNNVDRNVFVCTNEISQMWVEFWLLKREFYKYYLLLHVYERATSYLYLLDPGITPRNITEVPRDKDMKLRNRITSSDIALSDYLPRQRSKKLRNRVRNHILPRVCMCQFESILIDRNLFSN